MLPCGFRDHVPMPMSVESDSKVKANGWATELQDEIEGINPADPRFGKSVDAPWVDAECGLRAIKMAIKGKLKVIANASAIKDKDFEAVMAEMGWQKETTGARRDSTTPLADARVVQNQGWRTRLVLVRGAVPVSAQRGGVKWDEQQEVSGCLCVRVLWLY